MYIQRTLRITNIGVPLSCEQGNYHKLVDMLSLLYYLIFMKRRADRYAKQVEILFSRNDGDQYFVTLSERAAAISKTCIQSKNDVKILLILQEMVSVLYVTLIFEM